MEKTFTLLDLQNYIQETRFFEKRASRNIHRADGPSNLTVQNILRYSSALNILKTSAVGNICQLTN